MAAYGQMCVDQALRIVDLAAAGSFGCDAVLASELAMMTAAMGWLAEQEANGGRDRGRG
ncbi:hypothetical protein [Burkholderia sp. S-53]|uniref:hypothetical protein n=1 Tax=Burkholderia sp. S-53 TaxID=2906514 RepID=UPI0021CDF8D7|nr:hypothetical protein [Burkholderia sp. S-53]UXU86026.1 hypothetical protein LXM88_01710 [Burkholderia sp. S-53]